MDRVLVIDVLSETARVFAHAIDRAVIVVREVASNFRSAWDDLDDEFEASLRLFRSAARRGGTSPFAAGVAAFDWERAQRAFEGSGVYLRDIACLRHQHGGPHERKSQRRVLRTWERS